MLLTNKPLPQNEILREQLRHDLLDIGDVDSIDDLNTSNSVKHPKKIVGIPDSIYPKKPPLAWLVNGQEGWIYIPPDRVFESLANSAR
jgi:hypothetical protein